MGTTMCTYRKKASGPMEGADLHGILLGFSGVIGVYA
jgi:hypothetical protein